MPRFDQSFKAATKPDTPGYAAAAAKEAQLNNQRAQAKDAQLAQNLMGGAYLYNQGMGDNSPITDALRDGFGGGGSPMMAPGGGEMAVNPATWETGALGIEGAAPVTTVAPVTPVAPVTSGAIAPAAGPGLATTIGGPLAALGGYAALQDSLGENESDIAMSIANPMLDVATLGLHRDGGGPLGELTDGSGIEDLFNNIGGWFS
jgi:hypothetical protein